MRSGEEIPAGAGEGGHLLRRARRLLLAETAFARIIGATIGGTFQTALIVTLGGQEGKLGLAAAAFHVGSVGMLVVNPIINHIGSRRKFCLIWLGVVRLLRIPIALMPMLVYLGLGRESFYWPVLCCILISAFFGMSGEIARRSWISDLVSPEYRGQFFGRRIKIALLANIGVLLVGGGLLNWSKSDTFPLPGDGQALVLSVLLGMGGLAGWIGWSLLYRAPEPPMTQPRRHTGLVRSLMLPWQRPRFRPLLILAVCYFFAVGICMMFFDYYMLTYLGMGWMLIATVNVVGHIAAIAGASYFGSWADRVGARRVLTVGMIAKGFFPILWILATPDSWAIVFALVLLRAFNSAIEISWLRLSLNLSPTRNKAAYIAMYQAMVGAGLAFGATAGGALAESLKQFDMVILGFTLVPIHVLFILSAAARMGCLGMVRFIREPRLALAPMRSKPPRSKQTR